MPDYRDYVTEMVEQEVPEDFPRQLRSLCSTDSPMLFALAGVLKQALEVQRGIGLVDFTDGEAAVLKAVRLQGVVEGLFQAVDIVLQPVKELEDGRK